jgi:tetratricopeptide (TPR) repeat protein
VFGKAVAAMFCLIAAAAAEPYLPASDDVVLERLPAASDPRLREARRLARNLERGSDDSAPALEVARRYIDLGRSEGDPRFFGLAEGVLAPWLDAPDPSPAILIERSTLRRSRHDFDGALADLDAVLALRPDDVQAHLDRATLLEALGDYAGAGRACLRVLRLYPSLVGMACLSSARSLTGLARSSYDALAAAIEATPAEDPTRPWALTILGEIATRLGDPAAAERHFRAAIDPGSRDVYLLGAYADLLLDQNQPGRVLDLLEGEDRVDPLLLRRAIAARRASDPSAATLTRELEARFAALRQRGATTHLREEARLALHLQDEPARALDLAQTNWTRQRGPADARILLEAALASGTAEVAAPVLAWMEETDIEDVVLERLANRLADRSS